MAPNSSDANGVLFESDAATPDMAIPNTPVMKADNYPKKFVWRNIIAFAYLHIAAIYGGYLFLFSAKWQTDIFAYILYVMSGLGITAGAHRLWAHKSYKAKWPLRLILVIFNTLAFQMVNTCKEYIKGGNILLKRDATCRVDTRCPSCTLPTRDTTTRLQIQKSFS